MEEEKSRTEKNHGYETWHHWENNAGKKVMLTYYGRELALKLHEEIINSNSIRIASRTTGIPLKELATLRKTIAKISKTRPTEGQLKRLAEIIFSMEEKTEKNPMETGEHAVIKQLHATPQIPLVIKYTEKDEIPFYKKVQKILDETNNSKNCKITKLPEDSTTPGGPRWRLQTKMYGEMQLHLPRIYGRWPDGMLMELISGQRGYTHDDDARVNPRDIMTTLHFDTRAKGLTMPHDANAKLHLTPDGKKVLTLFDVSHLVRS